MTCYHPLEGYRARSGGISWSRPDSYVDLEVRVPCGQCIGCRLDRSRDWATRIMHESQMHDESCFLTLTYDDAHLPADGSLRKRDFQDFVRRLRRAVRNHISYFHCGEYGDVGFRPHYHAIVFGCDFPDRMFWARGDSGEPSYTSESLTALWPLGLATVGNCSWASAAYCARYVLKKVNGDRALDYYKRFDANGVAYWLEPEYATMSKRPAIGKLWFERFGDTDVVARDGVVVNGVFNRTPRYYDKLREEGELRQAKLKRIADAGVHAVDQTPQRLADREKVKKAAISTLKRSL